MALDKVRQYLKKYHLDDKIIELKESSSTVSLAAKSLGCEEERIAKTLSFMVNDKVLLIVMAGNVKIDNQKYKSYFHTKANMLKYDDVESLVGHKVGGVCPFAINEDVLVYLDQSLKAYPTVFPACGSSNSAIELTIKELELTSNYKSWIDVTNLIS